MSVASERTAGSRGSRASRTNYRVVSKTSNVDESLFGANTGPNGADTTTISRKQIEKLVGKQPMPGNVESIVISDKDLQRMKTAAVIETAKDVAQRKKRMEADKEARQRKSKERKEKMIQMEVERKKNAPLTETEKKQKKKSLGILAKAQSMLDEELDQVKHMNQMVAYGKCVTIRDAQIQEKVLIENEEDKNEAELDKMMEIERLRAISKYEKVETEKKKFAKESAKMIVQQMEHREHERELALEVKEQEQLQMLKHIERLAQEEKEEAERKKEAGKVLLKTVLEANSSQINRKQQLKDEDRMEDEKIAAYVREREAREAAHAAEQDRIKAEKEAEVSKLRAMQEKMADTKAEQDALRAKRAQEAAEREWRAKELKAAQDRDARIKDLAMSREQQMQDKEMKLAEQAQLEKEEFDRILRVQLEAERAEKAEVQAKREAALKHSDHIRDQIKFNGALRKQAKNNFLKEGQQLRERMEAEREKVEEIKIQKLEALEIAGVPKKYRAELESKKVSI